MGFNDLRDFLEQARRLGMLRVVEGAHWDLEIGAICQMMQESRENPILLFDRIPGFPSGFRVLGNHQNTPAKEALLSGFESDLPGLEIVRRMKERRGQRGALLPPREVEYGPVLENADRGQQVNLYKFPAPKWRTLEGGRYIGTANLLITRDPDESWVNMACYRQMIHDEKTVGLFIEPHHHGLIMAKKYWARGKACPVVACYGQDLQLWQAAIASAPWGISELAVAGATKGEPVETIRGELTGLPIPARAEIAVEGEVPPPDIESRREGPYREWPGYYSQEPFPQPVIRVRAVYYRNDPILTGPPGMARNLSASSTRAAVAVWENLERGALPGIHGVWAHGNGLFLVISLKQQFAGHAKMALLTAASTRASGSVYRFYVAVDEDIDPTDLSDVLWAITTRCAPEDQIEVLRGALSAQIDPLISPEKRAAGDLTCGRVLVNACKPWGWREQFGKSMTFTPEFERQVRERWSSLIGDGKR
jgi:UbiD family decarboxylase